MSNVQDQHVEKTMATVIEMMGRLDAVIKQENDALKKMDRNKFLNLQMEKLTLAKNYEKEAQKLLALRGNIRKADKAVTGELKTAHTSFVESADENLKILLNKRKAVQRVNKRIMEAARDTLVKKDERYNASGNSYQSTTNKTVSTGLMDTV
jgi:hypothetical protein